LSYFLVNVCKALFFNGFLVNVKIKSELVCQGQECYSYMICDLCNQANDSGSESP